MALGRAVADLVVEEVGELEEEVRDADAHEGALAGFCGGGGLEEAGEPGGDCVVGVVFEELGLAAAEGGAGGEGGGVGGGDGVEGVELEDFVGEGGLMAGAEGVVEGDCVGADGGDGLAEGALVDERLDVDVEVGQRGRDAVRRRGHDIPDVADVGGGAGRG